MIISLPIVALSASVVTLQPQKLGQTYQGIQNHDSTNFIIATFGADVVMSPPNGIKIGPGEFYEINGPQVGAKTTVRADTANVDITWVHN